MTVGKIRIKKKKEFSTIDFAEKIVGALTKFAVKAVVTGSTLAQVTVQQR